MKSERDLREDLINALRWEPAVEGAEIDVDVSEGVATLRGRAQSYSQKIAAADTVRNVRGVRAVANDLVVHFGDTVPPSDTAIAKAVADAIEWDSAVPLNAIKATVVDGWVTLSGGVEWQYQKSSAQIAAERTFGVKGVENNVVLRPHHVQAADVRSKIESAFQRSARLDAQHVSVRIEGSTVILTGTVSSLHERDEAERAAWAAPGVSAVDDRLVVVPAVVQDAI